MLYKTGLLGGLCLALVVLSGCAAKNYGRAGCASLLEQGWQELSFAEAEGFAGTVSYSKALSLLTAAKTQQQFEAFSGCRKNAGKARFYIRESRAGR